MNEDVLKALKNKDNINKAKENLKKRIKKEDAVKENLEKKIKKEEEEKIEAEKEEQERKKRYENYIIEAKNNNQIIINTIIKELVEKYMEMTNRYNNTINDDYDISIEYNLDWLEQYCHKIEKHHKYPYVYGDNYRCYESYNKREEDETKKAYYFLINIEDSYYEYSWEPVIFDIEKIKSFNLFSNFKLGKENLNVSAKYSTIKELISKAANEELEGIYDQELINYLKEVDQRIKYEKSIVESFSKHINTNTEIIYHYIYKRLIQNISNNETKRKYTISLRDTILSNSKDYEKLLIYIKQSDPKYNDIAYCLYRDYMNNERKYLLISKSLLRSMLEQDKEYGYLNMEYKTNLNIKFDGIVFASKIAEMQEEKGQSLKLQIKD